MRTLRFKTIITGFIFLSLSTSVYAELIYGFDKISVTDAFSTSVEFNQTALKNYQSHDNLKLRVTDGNKIIREDTILKKEGVWQWNKILPFSEHLTFSILKNSKVISSSYVANTKNLLISSDDSSLSPPIVRGLSSANTVYHLDVTAMTNDNKHLKIEVPKKLTNCKDKVLVLVFNDDNHDLLWQYYGRLTKGLISDVLKQSSNLKQVIAVDEGSCGS